jgi:multiple sugar transport system substrate-binding protein
MNKIVIRVLVMLLVTGTLAAQGGAAPREIVLRFPSWQQDEPGVSGWWKEQITAYERTHPGVRIELT